MVGKTNVRQASVYNISSSGGFQSTAKAGEFVTSKRKTIGSVTISTANGPSGVIEIPYSTGIQSRVVDPGKWITFVMPAQDVEIVGA